MIFKVKSLTEWHRHFALWPVYVGNDKVAWLQWVWRRIVPQPCIAGDRVEYREVQS